MPNLVLGGDTNLIFDHMLDRKANSKYIKTSSNYLIKDWIKEREIVDIWRVRNPDIKQYTQQGLFFHFFSQSKNIHLSPRPKKKNCLFRVTRPTLFF